MFPGISEHLLSHQYFMKTLSRKVLILFTCIFLLPAFCLAVQSPNSEYMDAIKLLSTKSFTEKEEAIKKIRESQDSRAKETLFAILQGDLYFTKKDGTLVSGQLDGRSVKIKNYITDEDLGVLPKRKLKKITINNSIRGLLKTSIAQIDLTDPDENVRLEAVKAILDNITPEIDELLPKLYEIEKNKEIKEHLSIAMALGGLRSKLPQKRIEALETVKGNLNPVIKNEIKTLLERETEYSVQKKAQKVLTAIETKIAWYTRIETFFFGLSTGSVLVLAAIGLAITFGVIGVINMAHGELIMIGAYTTYVIQQLLPNSIGWSLAISIPAAFCVSGIVGIIIEKSVIRFLYGRPLETLLATFGISLILQQSVRSIFSPLNRSVSTPEWMSGSIHINPILSLTTNRVTIFIFAMIVFGLLFLLLKKSALGLHVRAVSQNRGMARAMGVRAARVDALTFGLGSGIAGIAGVALSQLTNVGPNLGQAYIIDSFMVVVFGGVGNLWGTLLGGLSLGIANKFLEPWSGAVLAKIFILIFIILFIQKRPQGLFPQKGRAAE